MPRSNPEILAVPLSAGNLAAALLVADQCFPEKSDQVFLRSHWQRIINKEVSYYCEDDRTQLTLLEHLVFIRGEQTIGFGGLYRHDESPQREWLNWFGVAPTERSHGYGRKIVCDLIHLAMSRGISTLVGYTEDSVTNTSTKQFYLRLGFKPTELYRFRGEAVRLHELNLSKLSNEVNQDKNL